MRFSITQVALALLVVTLTLATAVEAGYKRKCPRPAACSLGTCLTGFEICGETCGCATTAEGTGFCGQDAPCDDLADCETTADCDGGTVCIVQSCCETAKCIAPCVNPGPIIASPVSGASGGGRAFF